MMDVHWWLRGSTLEALVFLETRQNNLFIPKIYKLLLRFYEFCNRIYEFWDFVELQMNFLSWLVINEK